ncbi:MAG: hypothetical protein ACWA40_01800 [Planktomarina sp.]
MSLRETIHRSIAKLFVKIGRDHRLLAIIRENLAAELARNVGTTVKHGPFKGFKLDDKAVWGSTDHPLKVLGLYEQPILNIIAQDAPWNALYNIGAADGFYVVGAVKTGVAQKAIAWEMVAESRDLIAKTAKDNGVADQIEIFGAADPQLADCTGARIPGAKDVVLVDIEGYEYTLLNDDILNRFSKSTVLVELHPFLVDDGDAKEAALIDRAAKHFNVAIVDDAVRDLTGLEEMRGYSDDARWLLCSEARERQMRWLHLTPKT